MDSERSGKRHGWNTLENYVHVHQSALEQHDFVIEDRTEFVRYTDAGRGAVVHLTGEIVCAGGVIIEVDKYLDVRQSSRGVDEVRGYLYRYHGYVRGGPNLLRYDNSHAEDEFHRHQYDVGTGGQTQTILARENLPTLIQVVSELEQLVRAINDESDR